VKKKWEKKNLLKKEKRKRHIILLGKREGLEKD